MTKEVDKDPNLDNPNIMSAREAGEIWGLSEGFVRVHMREGRDHFPPGTIRKFGKQWVVTTRGMEAITGRKDPRKGKSNGKK